MRIFVSKREEVTGSWRRLHNEELHNLYTSPFIIRLIRFRRTRWVGQVARMGEMRNVHRILVCKLEWRRPLGRPTCKREDDIKMNLREIGWEGVNWIHLFQDRGQWRVPVDKVIKLRVT
jgi:hypothetical protein